MDAAWIAAPVADHCPGCCACRLGAHEHDAPNERHSTGEEESEYCGWIEQRPTQGTPSVDQDVDEKGGK